MLMSRTLGCTVLTLGQLRRKDAFEAVVNMCQGRLTNEQARGIVSSLELGDRHWHIVLDGRRVSICFSL